MFKMCLHKDFFPFRRENKKHRYLQKIGFLYPLEDIEELVDNIAYVQGSALVRNGPPQLDIYFIFSRLRSTFCPHLNDFRYL